jgi:hypothetical protein
MTILVHILRGHNTFQPFGRFDGHLVYFVVIRFGMLYQEKSGNPRLGPML